MKNSEKKKWTTPEVEVLNIKSVTATAAGAKKDPSPEGGQAKES